MQGNRTKGGWDGIQNLRSEAERTCLLSTMVTTNNAPSLIISGAENLIGCLPRIRRSDREWHWRACAQDEGQTDVLLENGLCLSTEIIVHFYSRRIR
jgi:hypothetical protein